VTPKGTNLRPDTPQEIIDFVALIIPKDDGWSRGWLCQRLTDPDDGDRLYMRLKACRALQEAGEDWTKYRGLGW
jgi:hypothetical protein